MTELLPLTDDTASSPTSAGRILLVEDDVGLRSAVALVLRAAGFEVTETDDGAMALDLFAVDGADAVVLDVMLPGVDGFTICRELRARSQVPIVMMTARDAPTDVVHGLEIGADDYIVKPFEAAVLLARIRAALRRVSAGEHPLLENGDLRLDLSSHRAWRGTEELVLTATEFRLLAELLLHVGQAMTRLQLLERVWGYDYLGDSRLVDMAIKRLRDKIEPDPRSPTRIVTLRGVGYRFERS